MFKQKQFNKGKMHDTADILIFSHSFILSIHYFKLIQFKLNLVELLTNLRAFNEIIHIIM